MRVLVTGASGFVGGAVASALARDGNEVIGTGRRTDGWPGASLPGASYLAWDLLGPAPAELPEIDAVVHCAGMVDDWAPLALSMRQNVGGARAVRLAFPEARLVHVSSSSVYNGGRPCVGAREDEPLPTRFLSSYSESKAMADAELSGGDAIILRPHAVYGPGDTTLLPRLEGAVRRGQLILPRGARVLHSLTHIDNLIHAARCALLPQAPSGVYNVSDAEPVRLDAAIAEFLSQRGVDARLRSVPLGLAWGLAAASEASARLRGRRPGLTRYAVSQVGMQRTYNLDAARSRLGYSPAPTSMAGAEDW